MKDARIVWSDEDGDLRKKEKEKEADKPVNEAELVLKIRKLTAGKGRVVIEITGLPNNQEWCKKFASMAKKSIGVGGALKNGFIEIHAPTIDKVIDFLDKKKIKWKKTGG